MEQPLPIEGARAPLDLFKQQGRIHLTGEGVDADLPLAPAVVLFGPNDAEKTNVLRRLAALVNGTAPAPRDPFNRTIAPDQIYDAPGTGWNAVWFDLDLNRVEDRLLLFDLATGKPRPGEHRSVVLQRPFRFQPGGEETVEWEVEDWSADDFLGTIFQLIHEGAERTNEEGATIPDVPLANARLEISREFAAVHFLWPEVDEGVDLPEYVWFFAESEYLAATEVIAIDEISVTAALAQFRGYLESMRDHQRPWQDNIFAQAGFDPDRELRALMKWTGQTSDSWFDKQGNFDRGFLLLCAAISRAATELAPPFLGSSYTIELQPLAPLWWEANRGERLRLALLPRTMEVAELVPVHEPRGFDIGSVGAGLQPWALFAVHEAFRRARSESGSTVPVFIFDEPERHLHPTAQRDAAEFIASIVADGGNVVLATHAPVFLNAAIPNVEYVRVGRREGMTYAETLEPSLLEQIETYANELGLSRVDLLQLTRLALLVEGDHDRRVLNGFFGRELGDAFVRVLLLFGADNTLSTLDAQLLHQIGIPSYVMLDKTRDEQVKALNAGTLRLEDFRDGGKEARLLTALAQAARSRALPITLIPLPLPDIIWALPEQAMRQVAPAFSSWEKLTQEFKRRPTMNPKAFLAEALGRQVHGGFIDDVIAVSRELGLAPDPALTSAVMLVLERPTGPRSLDSVAT